MLIPLPHLTALAVVIALMTGSTAVAETDTTVLRAKITSLKADNADLAKLLEYAEVLSTLANDDPASARKARAPIARCLNTPLRPYCPLLRGLFDGEKTE